MAYMAGTEAEVVLLGSTQGGDGNDRYQIEPMAAECDQDDPADWGRWEARLRRQTRRLIQRHRDRIERVADALLAKGKLSEKQLDKLTGRGGNDVKVTTPMQLSRYAQRTERGVQKKRTARQAHAVNCVLIFSP